MKFLVISDTHSQHDMIDIPKTDILIFAGDANVSTEEDYFEFIQWFSRQKAKYKIFVPGNHDWYCYRNQNLAVSIGLTFNVEVLIDSMSEIKGYKIYGSPYTPKFMNWAFMLNGEQLRKKWNLIPDDLDILITHGPPKYILDYCPGGHVGCEELTKRVKEVKPKYHVFGHIHESSGTNVTEHTIFLNGSVLDGNYRRHNKVILGGEI